MAASAKVDMVGTSPISFTDSTGAQKSVPLYTLKFSGSRPTSRTTGRPNSIRRISGGGGSRDTEVADRVRRSRAAGRKPGAAQRAARLHHQQSRDSSERHPDRPALAAGDEGRQCSAGRVAVAVPGDALRRVGQPHRPPHRPGADTAPQHAARTVLPHHPHQRRRRTPSGACRPRGADPQRLLLAAGRVDRAAHPPLHDPVGGARPHLGHARPAADPVAALRRPGRHHRQCPAGAQGAAGAAARRELRPDRGRGGTP